jgi:hypothetical protein
VRGPSSPVKPTARPSQDVDAHAGRKPDEVDRLYRLDIVVALLMCLATCRSRGSHVGDIPRERPALATQMARVRYEVERKGEQAATAAPTAEVA